MKRLAVVSLALLLPSCASVTGSNRVLAGVTFGAVGGAGSGALLSPNSESRAINAAVFGLLGGLLGGGAAYFSDPNGANQSEKKTSLRDRELGSASSLSRQVELQSGGDLPTYLKDRFRPVVIEEFIEADRVSEEGTLHEPHKAYRIKRPAELIAQPAAEPVRSSEEAR
jgi:hypothetical protein